MQPLLFFVGSCWASFITTCTWRLEISQCTRPRYSTCGACGIRLYPWQLVPIIGYLVQRGKCIYCHQSISLFWPVAELVNGLVWACLPLFTLVKWPIVIIADTALLIVSTEDWFSNTFHFLWLGAILPLKLTICGQPLTTSTILLCGLTVIGYLSIKIGNGDIDFIVMALLACGPIIVLHTMIFSSILALTNRNLYRHQPCPFIPYLSCGLFLAILNQLT